MEHKLKDRSTLKLKIKSKKSVPDTYEVLFKNIYTERILNSERENKVMLDRLLAVTQGKELVLESRSTKFLQ